MCASPCHILCRSVKRLRRYGRLSIFQDGGRPPYWICFTCIWTTHKEHLLVFVTMQNVVLIGAVISMVCQFCEFGLKMPIPPFLGGFWGIWPPRWDTISTNLTKVSSTGHSGSSGILLMLVSIVVPEKLPGQKRCEVEEAEEEHEFWGVSDVFLK